MENNSIYKQQKISNRFHKEPLISVIIPAYNSEITIRETLKSLIKQTLTDFQVIFVDDGSDDSTFSIASETLAGSNIRHVLLRQANGGVSRARNLGIIKAVGKYLIFLDADDLVESNWLEKLALKATESNADVIFCGHDVVFRNGEIRFHYRDRFDYPKYDVISGQDALLMLLTHEIDIGTGSGMFGREFLVKNRIFYTNGCPIAEDSEFTLKALSKAKSVGIVKETLHHHVYTPKPREEISSLAKFHIVSVYLRLLGKFQKQNIDSKIIWHLVHSTIPLKYVEVIDYLIGCGYPEVHNIINKKVIRQAVKKYSFTSKSLKKNRIKRKLKMIAFIYFPSIYILLIKFIRRLRINK